ncbi:hypothetical protein P8452_13414 [Trifolium repens]|nr:hypothetical protein P8452_13414 [Trifolium repens]
MLEHRIPHLLPARRNFNWYQSRHPVLFLGEIHGRYFLALWTKKKMLYAEVEGECSVRPNMSNSAVVCL